MRFLIVLAIAIAAVSAAPKSPARIVGGTVTTINQYPDIVALLFAPNGVQFWQWCGGMVLNTRSVLTAAHCSFGDSLNVWRGRFGSTWGNSGGTVLNFSQFIFHPNYNGRSNDNDVAILRTTTAITYVTNAVRPASIAGSNYNLADNQVVWAAGWGAIQSQGPSSEQLRHVQIWTINQAICRTRYGAALTDNMLCSGWLDVGGRDQCQGDSGGPLYHNGVVVGICSWGSGCADPFFPGVNVRVSRYSSWIQTNA